MVHQGVQTISSHGKAVGPRQNKDHYRLKTPITEDELPEYFKQFLGVKMWTRDDDVEDATVTFLTGQIFFSRVNEIAKVIQELIAPSDGPPTTQPPH